MLARFATRAAVLVGALLFVLGPSFAATIPSGHVSGPDAGPKPEDIIIEDTMPIIELSTFLANALPDDGFAAMGWDYLSDSPNITWKTDGVAYGHTAIRFGVARLRVGGVSSQILRQSWQELPWTITLLSSGNPSHGPREIDIGPGGEGDNSCFGVGAKGCVFSASQALRSTLLKSSLLCRPSSGADTVGVYSVSTGDKKPSLVVFLTSGGSGGSSSSLSIRPLSDRRHVCNDPFGYVR